MLSLFSISSSHLLVTLHCKRNSASLQSVLHKKSLFFLRTDGTCFPLHGPEWTRCTEWALPSKVDRNRIILIYQAKASEKVGMYRSSAGPAHRRYRAIHKQSGLPQVFQYQSFIASASYCTKGAHQAASQGQWTFFMFSLV